MFAVEQFGKADAARIGIKNENGRVEFVNSCSGFIIRHFRFPRIKRCDDASGFPLADKPFAAFVPERPVNVMGVRHKVQGGQMLKRISQRRQAVDNFRRCKVEFVQVVAWNRKPVARRVHVFFRQIDIAITEVFRCIKFDFFVAHHLAHHLHLAVLHNSSGLPMVFKRVDYSHIGVGHGIGVVVGIYFVNVGFLAFQVELVHVILLRGQHVDGLIMHGGKCAVPIHFGNDLMVACVGGIHHNDIFRIDRPQADLVCRIAFRCPVPAVIGAVQHAFFFQILQKLLQIFAAEFFAFFKG